MPRTHLRRCAVAALLALALATSAVAAPLGAGRDREPRHSRSASLWSLLVHLIGASGGTLDPNGWR